MPKHALILTYAFPPISAVATYRPLRMCKALREADWDVTIITVPPTDTQFRESTESLLHYIPRGTKVIHIEDTIFRKMQIEQSEFLIKLHLRGLAGIIDKAALFIKKRVLWSHIFKDMCKLQQEAGVASLATDMAWSCPAVDQACKTHRTRPFDVIIVTMPPHKQGIVAYEIHQLTKVPYVLDYRDLFVGNPLVNASNGDKKLEDRFLQEASLVIGVTKGNVKMLAERTNAPVKFLPNGFDLDLFNDIPAFSRQGTRGPLKLIHAGTLYRGWGLSALVYALESIPETDYQLILAGNVDEHTYHSVQQCTVSVDMPGMVSADRAHELTLESDIAIAVGVSLSETGNIRAKIFEMLVFKKPALYVGNLEDEGAQLLKRCGLLVGCARTAPDLYKIVEELIAKKQAGISFAHPNEDAIKEYSFAVQGSRFVESIEEMLRQP